jgi:hypothetical protein
MIGWRSWERRGRGGGFRGGMVEGSGNRTNGDKEWLGKLSCRQT